MILNNMINQTMNLIRLHDRFAFDKNFRKLTNDQIIATEKTLDCKFGSDDIYKYVGCKDIDSVIYFTIKSYPSLTNQNMLLYELYASQFKYRNDYYSLEYEYHIDLYGYEFSYIVGFIELSTKAFDRGGTVPIVVLSENQHLPVWRIATYDSVIQKTEYLDVDAEILNTCINRALNVLVVEKDAVQIPAFKNDIDILSKPANQNVKTAVWRLYEIDNLSV